MDRVNRQLELPFLIRSQSDKVKIDYSINKDPIYWGFEHLNVSFDIEKAKGFPVCEAAVSYQGQGYHSVFGWIQVINMDIKDTNDQSSFVDIGALFKETDMPFFSFGNAPTFFDAPCSTDVANMNWTAQAFLVAVDGVVGTKTIKYVAGFKWGYKIADGEPQVNPVNAVTVQDWNTKVEFLNTEYPNWNFIKGNQTSSTPIISK